MFLHVSVHGEVCLQREQGDLPTEVEGCLPKEGVGQTPTLGTLLQRGRGSVYGGKGGLPTEGVGQPPPSNQKRGRYASYWNAFLLY